MKIRIANLLDGAAGTLVVAGSLTLPAGIRAQTTPYPTMDRPIAVSHGADEKKPLQQTTPFARVIEMKVELAWLADPVTSPYRLEARLLGSTLEVRGEVLDEAVLGHALRLARAECHMPVVSQVHLNPGLRAPSNSKPQEVLHREAFHALQQAFPAQAPSITITTLADGEIVLKGMVPTYEDKLAISRHLRQATTCSCVMNQLQVPGEAQEPRLSNSRRAPATLLAPAPLTPQPLQRVGHDLPSEPVALGAPSPAPRLPTEIKTPSESLPGTKVIDLGRAEASSPQSAASGKPSSTRAESEHPAAAMAKAPAKPVVYPTRWRRLEAGEIATPGKVVPAAASKETAVASTQQQSAAASKPHIYLRVLPNANTDQAPAAAVAQASAGGASTKMETAAVVKASSKLPVTATPPLVSTQDSKTPRPFNPGPQTANASPIVMPQAQPSSTSASKQEPYVADGMILVESMIKPASHTPPAVGSKPMPIVKTGPYISNGVILKSDAASGKPQPANPALADLQTRLQQRIAAVCGKPNRDVEVTAVSETNLAVRVKANSTLEGEDFSNRIFQLPELGPCQVSLDVVVMK